VALGEEIEIPSDRIGDFGLASTTAVERAHAIFGRVVAELGAGDTSATDQARQGLEFLVARLESPVRRLRAPPRFGISMKPNDDVRRNNRRR
jgi:hypothetical protein